MTLKNNLRRQSSWASAGIVFMALFGAMASADEGGAPKDEGFYAAAEGGYVEFGDYCGSGEAGCENRELYYSLLGGYQFSPYFSVEASGLLAKGFEKIYATQTAAGADLDIVTRADFRSYTLGARVLLPLGENFSVFGKAGAHLWQLDRDGSGSATAVPSGLVTSKSIGSDVDGAGAYFGAGAQYAFDSNIVMRFDYTYFASDNTKKEEFATIPKRIESYGGSIMFYF